MNKVAFILMFLVGSLNAMDTNKWQLQIAREQRHEEILCSFTTEEFQHKKLTPEEIAGLISELEGLRSTAAYVFLNRALLGLAKKSVNFGSLKDELMFARILIEAGAKIKYKQDIAIPSAGPLNETGAAPLGRAAKLKKESTFCIAQGDLRDLFDKKEAGIKE